jgi:hypothetical protein
VGGGEEGGSEKRRARGGRASKGRGGEGKIERQEVGERGGVAGGGKGASLDRETRRAER